MSNEHQATAERVYALVETGKGMDAQQQRAGATMAQVQATLALAYEQRTANLIAVWQSESPLEGVNYKPLGAEIKERLGL